MDVANDRPTPNRERVLNAILAELRPAIDAALARGSEDWIQITLNIAPGGKTGSVETRCKDKWVLT